MSHQHEAEAEFVEVMGRFPGFRAYLSRQVAVGNFDINSSRRCFYGLLGLFMGLDEVYPYTKVIAMLYPGLEGATALEKGFWVDDGDGSEKITLWLETL